MRLLVGIGGASCSGKSTLCKRLSGLFPNARRILSQDAFFRPDSEIPLSRDSEGCETKDWDSPRAIDFDAFVHTLLDMKHYCQGHGETENLSGEEAEERNPRLHELIQSHKDILHSVEIIWVDGFLLYDNPKVIEALNLCLFLKGTFLHVNTRLFFLITVSIKSSIV